MIYFIFRISYLVIIYKVNARDLFDLSPNIEGGNHTASP